LSPILPAAAAAQLSGAKTVPGNEGKELAPGTLNAILKKAGLK
jgi:predicted RNA binding protein YcfA (HicA-like mRNA interferase family)